MFKTYQELEVFFQQRDQLGMKPGLERMNTLLEFAGNPQRNVKAIHIAGTNGKGSTVQYMKEALRANKYCVGVFTSPSLTGLTGHIWMDDKKIPQEQFLLFVNKLLSVIERLDEEANQPTTFEILTAVAFMYFAETADIALIEAGMGGREDTTNCFRPILSIITTVEKDHTAYLGDTFTAIAYQKAGIIKHEAPVVVGYVHPDALAVIQKEALLKSAQLYRLTAAFDYTILERNQSEQLFQWRLNAAALAFEITLNTKGLHQADNASLAIMALYLLSERGYDLNWQNCIAGIAATSLPGRFELVHNKPRVFLDGAHNPSGVKAFIETVKAAYPNEEKHLLFAAFKDKDLASMLEQMGEEFKSITLTTFDHPRAASAAALKQASQDHDMHVVDGWKNALIQLNELTNTSCIFVTGSLHFIAEVRKYFRKPF